MASDGSILSGRVSWVLAKSTISRSMTFYNDDGLKELLLVQCYCQHRVFHKNLTFKKRSLQCCTSSCSLPGKRFNPTGKRRFKQATIKEAAISLSLSRLRSRDFFFFYVFKRKDTDLTIGIYFLISSLSKKKLRLFLTLQPGSDP
jgi:hypothetical protein